MEATTILQIFQTQYMKCLDDYTPEQTIRRGFSTGEPATTRSVGTRRSFAFVGPENERVGIPREVVLAVLSHMYALAREYRERIDWFQVGTVEFGTEARDLGRVSWGFT